jgi:T5SS/PEP-CTERM-associated repeat protein
MTLSAHGNGGTIKGFPPLKCSANAPQSVTFVDASISFQVTDQPETVAIVISGNISGPSDPNEDAGAINYELNGPNGTIQHFSQDTDGTTDGTPLTSQVLPPGMYVVRLGVSAATSGLGLRNGGDYSFNASISVGVVGGADIHWNNPAGGDFNTASNWNPQQVPTSLDSAFFDLPNLSNFVPVNAGNVGIGNLFISGMPVHLTGSIQVLNSLDAFQVGKGGALLLDSGSVLLSNDGLVGAETATSTSTVVVTGQGTRWTVGGSHFLAIGFSGPGIVDVDSGALLNAQKEIDVGVTTTPGRLEVHHNALVTTPALNVGNEGGGSTVLVDSGGAIQLGDALQLGDPILSTSAVNQQGVVTIAGISSDGTRQSSLSAHQVSVAGASGTEIEAIDGGLLDISPAGLFVGFKFTSGKVHVHGRSGSFASTVNVAGSTAIGPAFAIIGSQIVASELTVEDGGRLITDGGISLGQNHGDIGILSASNTGSADISIGGVLHVGRDGQGTLNISSSGVVTSSGGNVGDAFTPFPDSIGNVFISGPQLPTSADSRWLVLGDCVVGPTAKGEINLFGTPVFGSAIAFGATVTVTGTLTV